MNITDNKQAMTTLEMLPNELFIRCFKYLNSIDILYSFSQLNTRFNKLISSIRLLVNCENIEQPLYDQFCKIMSLNKEISKQIYSLHLSNENICWQIQSFLLRFSLDQFIHLQSLTLKEVTENNFELIKSKLSYLDRLSSFHYTGFNKEIDAIISILPTMKLKILTIPTLPDNTNVINELSSLENLTVSSCNQNQLTSIRKSMSQLKYLKIGTWDHHNFTGDIFAKLSYINDAIHLTHLTIDYFSYDHDSLKTILKQTPSLTNLKINIFYDDNAIHASPWENIIRLYLPYLISFQFVFSYIGDAECSHIKMWFEEFYEKFWIKEHHWYTEYVISNRSARIYTIPHISNTYRIERGAYTYCNSSMNDVDRFEKVTDLVIDVDVLGERIYPYYFSHIKSLCLTRSQETSPIIKRTQFEFLKTIVNLANVTSLNIKSANRSIKPSILVNILKEAQHISSLAIDRIYLKYLLRDGQLCEYLTKTIRKLEIFSMRKTLFNNLNELKEFCQIFSSTKQLICINDNQEFIFYLFKHLSQLSMLNLQYPNQSDCGNVYHFNPSWLEDGLKELGEIKFIKSSKEIKIYLLREYQTSIGS
ncbi:hypothetical protein I4U23_016397 [Adineta vaga]|nr:hypothetical protein I4U23_016397 [Adineta vaga]